MNKGAAMATTTTNANSYQVYINNVLALARYIVIKSSATADSVNNYISAIYGADQVNTQDPTTWRYYMNLAGQYHFADTPMMIVSMDTLQTIEFNAINLRTHTATARAYQFGERNYLALVAQYPEQITLINGILNPVNISTAISAADGQILTYPESLVEFNEYTFINKLQRWILGFKTRWVNEAYTVSDNLYTPFVLGIMYALLPQVIIALRLEACKTNEAHSFHVQQYLLSHGLLGVHLEQLTTRQSLELYRNINYLERNAGQQEVFEWLVDHIMTERDLPLASYTMQHDVSQIVENGLPTITFVRTPVNLGYNLDNIKQITLDEMLTKEQPMARDNTAIQQYVEPVIEQKMQMSVSNVLLTKALESSMVDYSNSVKYPLADALVNNWLWMSSLGYYDAAITFINPASGETVPIFVLDAFCLAWYALNASVGITLNQIPPMVATRVPRIPIPTVSELMAVVDQSLVPVSTIQQIHDLQPTIQQVFPFLSTEAFYNLCVQIYTAANTQNNLTAYQEHHEIRGYVKNATSLLWSDNLVHVASAGETYGTWFAERNLDIATWTPSQWGTLYTQLVADATGQSSNVVPSVANIQAAMIGMMSQLSSYSIQYMSSINEETIVPAEWAAIRVGNVTGSVENHMEATDLGSRVLEQHPSFSNKLDNKVTKYTPLHDNDVIQSNTIELKIRNLVHESDSNLQHTFFNAGHVRFHLPDITLTGPGSTTTIPLPGIDAWLSLPPTEQQQITDIWGSDFSPEVAGLTPLATAIRETMLSGANYVQEQYDLADIVTVTNLGGFAPAS